MVEKDVMATAVRAYRFEVSDYFFRLTTEAVRLFSNGIHKHSCLSDVVDHRACRVSCIVESYEVEDLKGHLRVIPAEGDIALTLEMPEKSAEIIEVGLPGLARALDSPVQFADVISLLLFDLIVERNATELITKLGISSAEARDYRPRLKRRKVGAVPVT